MGKNNIFGHPNKEILEKLENNKIKIYRTDLHGEIRMKINNKGNVRIKTQIN